MKRLFSDMVRYGFVSVAALLVDFGILMLLHSVFGMNYLVSATIGFSLGLIVNYWFSNNKVFTNPKIKSKAMNFAAFATIGIIGLMANDVIIWFSHDRLGLSVFMSKVISATGSFQSPKRS